jgi:hypothetical protein
MPCTKTGETDENLLEERWQVENVDEIIGQKDFYFKV